MKNEIFMQLRDKTEELIELMKLVKFRFIKIF